MNFNVTAQELVNISKSLQNTSESFLNEVKAMYNTLADLNAKWEGAGSSGYYNTINNYKDDVNALGVVISEYAAFLNKAATLYTTTDNDIASQAGRL